MCTGPRSEAPLEMNERSAEQNFYKNIYTYININIIVYIYVYIHTEEGEFIRRINGE